MSCFGKSTVTVLAIIFYLNCVSLASAGGGDREHVHLKIHIPKIIKKHTHVQTIYKVRKMPVLEESDEDEHKDGSENYVRIDPKTLSALKAASQYVTGNELRSMKWTPRRKYPRGLRGAFSSQALALKRLPKHVRVINDLNDEDYPQRPKAQRLVKQVVPTYDIQGESGDDYEQSEDSGEYSESNPIKSYAKQAQKGISPIQFIPAADLAHYIPTIPLSALTMAQSQYKPVWTPSELLARNKAKDNQGPRPVRSSRTSTMRVYSTGSGADYSTPVHF